MLERHSTGLFRNPLIGIGNHFVQEKGPENDRISVRTQRYLLYPGKITASPQKLTETYGKHEIT